MKNPDWLTYSEDGMAVVTMSRPCDVGGVKVSTVNMREPLVEDQLAATASGGENSDTELRLFCNLCQLAPEEIRKMPLRDYKRLQAAYLGFLV